MRTFIILGFLMAAANAAGLGYNYGPGLSGTGGLINYGGLISRGGLISTGSGLISSGNYGSGILSTGELVSSGGALINGGSLGGGIVNIGGPKLINIGSLDAIPQTVEVNKQFIHFTAPDEAQDEGYITQQLSNVLKKNIQVVFIKAPENNAATNAALQLAKQAIEQKTSIYVLSKQNDGAQLVGQIQQIQENVPTVPEVRFIKYRTQGDLINAKNIIQSQYNNIEGTSQVIDGGVAPVLNYASGGNSLGSATVVTSGIGSGIGSGVVVGPTVVPAVVSDIGSSVEYGIGSGIVTGSTVGPTIATDIVSGPTFASNVVSGPTIVTGSSVAPTISSEIITGSSVGPAVEVNVGPTVSSVVDGYLPPSALKK